MRIRYAEPDDKLALIRMRAALWPHSIDEHARSIDAYFDNKPCFIDQIVVCENDQENLVGFTELRVRNYAEGSDNMAVPYIEGWFVEEACRGQGIGALLMAGAEQWARSLGYSELASDAAIDDERSIAAHLALGFVEVDRTVCFLKKL